MGNLLRKIAYLVLLQTTAVTDLPIQRFNQGENGFHECGFTRSVLPDDAEVITLLNGE